MDDLHQLASFSESATIFMRIEKRGDLTVVCTHSTATPTDNAMTSSHSSLPLKELALHHGMDQ